jgi:hypothetical protein
MTINMTYEEWVAKFHPVKNTHTADAPYDGTMFETYGPEFEEVSACSRCHVWTLVEEDGHTYIVSGGCRVNRIGYFITSKFWAEGDVVLVKLEDKEELSPA